MLESSGPQILCVPETPRGLVKALIIAPRLVRSGVQHPNLHFNSFSSDVDVAGPHTTLKRTTALEK